MRLSRKKFRKKYRRFVAQRQRRVVENNGPMQSSDAPGTYELGSFYASGPAISMSSVLAKSAIAQTSDPLDQMYSGEMALALPESPVLTAGMGRKAAVKDNTNKAANSDNLPIPLRLGLEQFSGMDLSGIRVYKNSSKPAQLNALAYTQGQEIHLAQGQEKHLPHEGWHAVQQMQGRVKPTMQAKGVSINDAKELERDAEVMGAKAMDKNNAQPVVISNRPSVQPVIQMKKIGHRTLTWADFTGKPKKSKYEASTSSGFHDPKIRKVVPSVKSLRAVDSGEECSLGRKAGKIYKVNIAIDPTRIKVKAYMQQERSRVKAWVNNLKARVKKCNSGLVKKCSASFTRQYSKVSKQQKKAVQACKKSYNKRLKKVIKDSINQLSNCRKTVKKAGSWYELSVGGKRLRARNAKECKTLRKQYRSLSIKNWFYSIKIDGEMAKANTKKACGNNFARRYREIARKPLSWSTSQAGEQARITSKEACSNVLLTACVNRLLPAASRQLLKHEQVHFDITEVKARETEAKLKSLVAGFDKKVMDCGKKKALGKARKILKKNVRLLNKAYKQMSRVLKKTQKRYDSKTAHGKVEEAQTRWRTKISEKLKP